MCFLLRTHCDHESTYICEKQTCCYLCNCVPTIVPLSPLFLSACTLSLTLLLASHSCANTLICLMCHSHPQPSTHIRVSLQRRHSYVPGADSFIKTNRFTTLCYMTVTLNVLETVLMSLWFSFVTFKCLLFIDVIVLPFIFPRLKTITRFR